MAIPPAAWTAADAGAHLLVAAVTGVVAALVLAANHRRNWNQWLALFLGLVAINFLLHGMAKMLALEVVQGRLDQASAEATGRLLASLAMAALVLDPAVLVYFASVFPRRGPFAERPLLTAALAAPALGFLAYEVATRGLSYPQGPVAPASVAFAAYLAACYAYAAFRLLGSFLAEPSRVMADQVGVVATGLLVAALPRVALTTVDAGFPLGPWGTFLATPAGSVALQLAELGLRLGVLWGLWALARASVLGAQARGERIASGLLALRRVALAFAVFSLLWAVERAARVAVMAGMDPPADVVQASVFIHNGLVFTLRWFVFAAAIVAGILRFEVLSVRRAAGLRAGAALAGAGGVAGVALLASAAGPWAAGAAGLGLFGAGAAAGLALAASHRGGARGSAEAPRSRRLEVYAAQVAAALAAGDAPAEVGRRLAPARARLEVTPAEHAALLAKAARDEAGGAGEGKAAAAPGPPGYAVVRRLGDGASAAVDLAVDDAGREVVLKRFRGRDPALRDAARRELEVARRVSHPNLLAIHALEDTPAGLVLVTEHAPRGSLRDALAAGPLPPAEAAGVLRGCLAGLAALHEAGIVHGDLKPENVLLGADGGPKLADFGTARAAAARQTLLDGPGGAGVGGSLLYLAPELLRGGRPTARSDLYAVGAMAYEMLRGEPLLDARGGVHAALRQLEGPQQRPWAGPSPAWAAWLDRALAMDPGKRFQDAAEMMRALADVAPRPGPAGSVGGRDRPGGRRG